MTIEIHTSVRLQQQEVQTPHLCRRWLKISIPFSSEYISSPDNEYVEPAIVTFANENVEIRTVLKWLGVHVPQGFDRWKIRCPFSDEHKKPLEKNCRVYDNNTMNCFALHGYMDPVKLWQYHVNANLSRVAAARSLLEKAEITLPQEESYQEKMERLMTETNDIEDTSFEEALMLAATEQPSWNQRQYDEKIVGFIDKVFKISEQVPVKQHEMLLTKVKPKLITLLS